MAQPAKQKNENQTDKHLKQIANLKNELILEKQLVKKLKQTQEDWSELIEKVQPTIQALSEKIKELKSNLHLKNQELTNVLQSLPNGLIVTDLEGIVQTFNRAAISITGIQTENAVGSHINDLFQYAVLPDEVEENQLDLIERGFQQQFSIKGQNEAPILLKSITTLMKSDDDESQGIIVNVTDITKIKQLEEEAERKNRLTAMGEIAMQVAHELRNPLGSIELFISMMKQDFDAESEEMSLSNHISAATRSMNHIISNLLEYTSPRHIVLDELDLDAQIVEFLEFSEFSAAQLQIELSYNNSAKEPVVLGNKDLIKQMLHNLFVNACQAMPDGGGLRIHLSNYRESNPVILERLNKQIEKESQELLKLSFEDTGKGMTEDTKKRIFDPFFTTREQGTGLGLSIVHNTMISHGGTVQVSSELEQGTVIDLLFPVPAKV